MDWEKMNINKKDSRLFLTITALILISSIALMGKASGAGNVSDKKAIAALNKRVATLEANQASVEKRFKMLADIEGVAGFCSPEFRYRDRVGNSWTIISEPINGVRSGINTCDVSFLAKK